MKGPALAGPNTFLVKQKPFGANGPLVPVIGQGTWPMADPDALRYCISLGMTHIDTAEMYGAGRAEEIVGEAIRSVARDRIFVVTKVLPHNATAKGVARSCERSLKRLRTEYVDCYLLHWRGEVPIEETMHALEGLVSAGKARSLGVSNFDPWDLREAAAALRTGRIACDQVLYNLDERTIEDHELVWARQSGGALVAYTPLGDRPVDARKKRYAPLVEIARARGVTPQAVALAFLTRDPSVLAIPRASRIEHVAANAAAGDLELRQDEIETIDAAFPKADRVGALPTN